MTPWKRFVKARMMVAFPPSFAACAESATAYTKSAAASALSAAASAERASAAADRAAAAAKTAANAAATAAANAESARAAIRAVDVALARVEAIHAKVKDAHTKIFQATSYSSMQPMSEKAVEPMEHVLPHEVAKRELEMQEAAEIEERQEEELRVAEDEVEPKAGRRWAPPGADEDGGGHEEKTGGR